MSESLKVVLTNIVVILMILKLATLSLLKIEVFWNEGYDAIISVHDATNEILPSDLKYIVDMAMWSKFGNFSISMREVITTSLL